MLACVRGTTSNLPFSLRAPTLHHVRQVNPKKVPQLEEHAVNQTCKPLFLFYKVWLPHPRLPYALPPTHTPPTHRARSCSAK